MSDRPLPPMKPYPAPMPERMPPGQDVPQGKDVFYFVFDKMEQGDGRREIIDLLVSYGYSADDASMIVADVAERRRHFLKERESKRLSGEPPNRGRTNMFVGAIVCALGIVITVASLLLVNESGGKFVLAWGAIVFGGIQFIYGWMQSHQT